MGSHLNLSGYSRIGLQAQVATYLGEYETVLGNYGLALQLFFKVPNLVDGKNTFSKFVNFDSSEFFGNIYSFDSYRTQEVVYDLTEYQDFILDRIKLFIYQRVNFKDKNGEMIEAPQDEYSGHNIAPNISFKDFYICTGVPADRFESDTIELICNNNNDYYKDIEDLSMADLAAENSYIVTKQCFNNSIKPEMISRTEKATLETDDIIYTVLNSTDPQNIYDALIQILKIDAPSSVMTPEERANYIDKYNITDEEYEELKQVYPAFPTLVNYIGARIGRETYNQKDVEAVWLHKDESLGTIGRVEEGALPLHYTIRWYRNRVGAQAPDPWAGAHWDRFYGCREEPDVQLDYCITEQELSQAKLVNENIDIATDSVRVLFKPNVNNAQEQLKAILLCNEFNDSGEVIAQRFIAASKPLVFYNKDDVRSQATVIDMNTLAIRIDDEERGKYFLYNRADDLPETEANEIRVLTAVFDPDEPDVYKKTPLQDFSTIEWTFPVDNTMITPATDATPGAVKSATNVFTGVTQVGYFINSHLNRYATNNTVQLKVMKDGLSWEADCTFVFGTAGTSGSDYTLVLTWRNINKVLDVTYPGWDSLKGEVALQDRTGKYITIPTGSELEYDWLVSEIPATSEADSNYDFVVEDRDFYYPIFNVSSKAIFERSMNGDLYSNYRNSDNSTYGGYYYYLDSGYTGLLTALSKASGRNFTYGDNKFDTSGSSTVSSEEVVDDVAFFDLNEKKFIPITDSAISDIDTVDDGRVKITCNQQNIYVTQFYRKRRNKISLNDKKVVNQNEVFFQNIYEDVFNDEDIYATFLDNMNYWPEKTDESDNTILNIQNQDNILNLGTLQFDKDDGKTYSIGEDLVSFLNQEHTSNFKNELKTWINAAKNYGFKKNGEIIDSSELSEADINKMLVELVFNLKNIYEYVLNKRINNFGWSSINNLKYYFYDKESKKFKHISEYDGPKSDLFDNKAVFYELDEGVDNSNLEQYEFPKPKLEYKPLTLLNTTTSNSQLEDPYSNSSRNKVFDINLTVKSNSSADYLSDLYLLFFGQPFRASGDNSSISNKFQNMFSYFQNQDSKFKKRSQVGKDFNTRDFWIGKESLLNDYFAIREYYYYLLSNGWTEDYPGITGEDDFKIAFCEEFLDNSALAAANFPESFSVQDQRVTSDESKFKSLIYTYLLYEDNINNTYRDIDAELKANNNTDSNSTKLKQYYNKNFSKLVANDKYFYMLKDYSSWWSNIYRALSTINNEDVSLNDFINNYFYSVNSSTRKLKLKQIENLSEDKGIWLEGDGVNYITDKLRQPGYNLVEFYNDYLLDSSTTNVKFLTGVSGTEDLLEIFLQDYFTLLSNIFNVQENGLKNKIKGLILNEIISASGVTDQAKNYNLVKTPATINNSTLNNYRDYLIKTNRSDFPYEQLSQYLQQSLDKYDTTTETPLSDTFKLYQDLYNVLNDVSYYENFDFESYYEAGFFSFLNSSILFETESFYYFSGIDDKITENYLNELLECIEQGQPIPLFVGNYLKIYEESSNYKISIPKYSFILDGTLKDAVEEAVRNSTGYTIVNEIPTDVSTHSGDVCYYISSIDNFIDEYDSILFPETDTYAATFINRLEQNLIRKVKVTLLRYRRNQYVGLDEENQRLYGWQEVNSINITAELPSDTFDTTFLKFREVSPGNEYYWFNEDWNSSIQLKSSTGVIQDLDFNIFIEFLTGNSSLGNADKSQLFLWMRCLKNLENTVSYHYNDINIRLNDDCFIQKVVVDEETSITSNFYYYLNDDLIKYVGISWTDAKRKELAQLLLNKYLYTGVTRVDSSSSDFSLYTFNNSSKSPYKCYTCEGATTSLNEPEKILYHLILKNPASNISYTDLSRFLYTNSTLFWRYFSYRKIGGNLGSEQHSNTYYDKQEYDSLSRISPIDGTSNDLVGSLYVVDRDCFSQYNISSTILPSQLSIHKPYSVISGVTNVPGEDSPMTVYRYNQSTGEDYNETHITYYIVTHLEDIRKQVIVSNIAPIVPEGESYDGLTGAALTEFLLAKLELQNKAFTSKSFSFISNFYNNLNQYIQVATQTLNRSNEADFLRFKIDMYEFLSNQELESKTSSFVDGKLKEYFDDNPIDYLINISNLNVNSESEENHIFIDNEGIVYNVVLVDTSGKKIYNLDKLIKNISSEDWLYSLLLLLKSYGVKINPASNQYSWNKVCYLESANDSNNDYRRIIMEDYFTKAIESTKVEKAAELERQIADDYLDDISVAGTDITINGLRVWGKNRSSVTSFSSNYKILYNDKISNLSAVFGSNDEYLTVVKLSDKYNNIFMKSTIYFGDTSDENSEKYFNYYNAGHHKAFINIDGQYVLDPYDDWIEEETYYEPIQVKEYACKIPPLKFVESKVNKDDATNTLIEIYPRTGLSADTLMKSLSILRITLTKFGNHNLVAHFPIPLRNGTVVEESGQVKFEAKYLEGATEVRYTSGGTTEYNKNPYRLFIRKFDVEKGAVLEEYEPNASQSLDKTGINDVPGWNWGILIPSKERYGTETANFVPHIIKRLLEPSPIYIPNLSQYSVQYYDTNKGIFLWNQPILSYEDNYPSTTLNGWNGEEILTDNDTGTIVASAFAAGKKERDNTFTGLMLGDWSRSDTDTYISKQTGIYGFYHGSMAYAFKDDGTGFIGRDGRGRIYFNGQNSTIYSSEWIGNEPLGMLLDLDDGVIQLNSKKYNGTQDSLYTSIYGQEASITVLGNTITATVQPSLQENLIDATTYKYITLSAQEDHYPLAIGTTSILSQRKFKVAWDGTAYIQDGVFSGILHAKGGILDDNFIVNGTLYGGTLLGGALYASALYANYGQIGPWKITPAGLVNLDNSTMLIGQTPDIVLTTESGKEYTMEGANNPYATSIITNRILLSTTGVSISDDGTVDTPTITGALGYIQGATSVNGLNIPTQGIGLSSDGMITVSSMEGEIGIKAGKQLHLEGGSGSGNAPAFIQVNHADNSNIGANGIVLHGSGVQFWDIPADKQWGIYARFA